MHTGRCISSQRSRSSCAARPPACLTHLELRGSDHILEIAADKVEVCQVLGQLCLDTGQKVRYAQQLKCIGAPPQHRLQSTLPARKRSAESGEGVFCYAASTNMASTNMASTKNVASTNMAINIHTSLESGQPWPA